ncbi:MAG: hypothetical protein HQK66_01100 [Desulfamplus sp.]|nr:hypothetical protein [Desulfamplus sp.]
MLSIFDWIRLSDNGAELMATLEYFKENKPDIFPEEKAIAGPVTLMNRPCSRCWIYPCSDNSGTDSIFCKTCHEIVARSRQMGRKSRYASVVWANVNLLPKNLNSRKGFYATSNVFGSYILEPSHFLLVLNRYKIKDWLQELLLYHGGSIKGLLQIFPTCGSTNRGNMNDILARAIQQDARFPMNMLRVRFFSSPFQLFAAHKREKSGMLTFEIMEFLDLLQMAFIYRSLLRPEDQQLVKELISLENPNERRFQWGRFSGSLKPEARDMLDSWNIPMWTKHQIILLYELMEYVEYASS